MHAGSSFSYSPISVLLRQPLSIKKSYAGAIQRSYYLTTVGSFIRNWIQNGVSDPLLENAGSGIASGSETLKEIRVFIPNTVSVSSILKSSAF
jgi:hypothetical protein